jgi:branched-chain amino acid transport system permease protein
MVLALMALSDLTRAWQVYVGLAFVLVVMAAPGGLAGAATDAWTAWRAGRFRGRGPAAALLLAGAVPALAGTVALLEMAYHRQLDAALDPRVRIGHVVLDTTSPATWAVALAGAVAGVLLVAWGWRTWRSAGAGDVKAGA